MATPVYSQKEGHVDKYVFTWSQHATTNVAPNICVYNDKTLTAPDTVVFAAGAKSVTAIIDATATDNEEAGDINVIAGTGIGGTFEDGATGQWTAYNYTDAKVEGFAVTPAPFMKFRSDNTAGNVAPIVTVLVAW